MAKKTEARYFTELFLLFIAIEMVLYTIIVYFDAFSLKSDFAKRDPAFMVFYGISAIIFFIFISRLDKVPRA